MCRRLGSKTEAEQGATNNQLDNVISLPSCPVYLHGLWAFGNDGNFGLNGYFGLPLMVTEQTNIISVIELLGPNV